jgi:hypothetical protein
MKTIISEKDDNAIATTKIKAFMSKNNIAKYLEKSNFKKEKGTTVLEIFTFIFSLVFTGKNLYRTMNGNVKPSMSKDAVYRFLESSSYNWRKFLLLLSSMVIATKLDPLTSENRKSVLIIDDSKYDRNRSKNVELLAKVYDHVSHKYEKGFRLLTLAWSDGVSLIPLCFSLLSSAKKKNILCPMNETIDRRSNGFKSRAEATEKSTSVMFNLLQEAKKYGVKASYILFDSWFAFPSVIMKVRREGFHVAAMLKAMKTVFYTFNGKLYKLESLYSIAGKNSDANSDILSSVVVEIGKDEKNIPILAKIVFVKSKNKKREWLAVISTDLTLTNEEIIALYGKRWDIEVFFKVNKSFLALAKEFQCRSYDSLVAHTTIVFARYIMLSLEERKNKDSKALGGLFFECCDEVKDIDFSTALTMLLTLLKETLRNVGTIAEEVINSIVSNFIQAITLIFKGRSLFLSCES